MAFEQLGTSLVNPLLALWASFVNILPGIIAAVIVLLFGYLVASIVEYVVGEIIC